MKCQEFEDRLQNLLDQRVRPERDEQLIAHAHECVACRQILTTQDAIFDVLPRTRPRPSSNWATKVADEVVAAVVAEPQVAARGNGARPVKGWKKLIDVRWLTVGLVGVAAAVILAYSPAWRVITNPTVPAQQTANVPVDQPGGANAQQPLAIGTQNKEEIATPARSPADPPINNGGPLIEYQVALQHWMEALPENVEFEQLEDYSPGIRPLRTTFGLAIDTLRRTLPGHREWRTHSAPAGAFSVPASMPLA